MAAYTLLLADDSVAIHRLVDQAFANEDIQVVVAEDGDEAIARIRTDRPDVILADIVMPKRSGYEVAAFVKGQSDLAHIPVLLLAGAFEPVDHARVRQTGCDGVLVKPFKAPQVIERVRELLERVKRSPTPGAASDVLRPVARSIVADHAAMRPAAPADPSLEDYFGRLDAALAPGTLQIRRVVDAADGLQEERTEDLELPTLEGLLAGEQPRLPGSRQHEHDRAARGTDTPVLPTEPPVHIIHSSPPPPLPITTNADRGGVARSRRSVMTEAFGALLAVELGEPGAAPVRLTSLDGRGVTDAMIDEVTQRVLDRLASDAEKDGRDVVARIVSEVAERLVRDEIRRIREGRK